MTGLFLVIALVAVLLAVAFFLSSRTARAALDSKEGTLRALQSERDALAKEVSSSRAELKERREEAASLRDQVRDAKKRAFEQQEAQKKAGGMAALRADVEKLSVKLAEARAEGTAAAERAKALEAQADKAARDLERERATAAQAIAQSKALAEAQREPVAAKAEPVPFADDARVRAEADRADKAEAKLAEVKKRLGELDKDLKAARGRLETDRRVYVVQKGELDLAHDRIAELRRRYDALRKEHEELIDAVRQAAREERRQEPAAPKPADASVPPTGE